MSYLFLEDGDLLESVELEISLNEGFFSRIREIISNRNKKREDRKKYEEWKIQAKNRNFEALAQNVTPYKRKTTNSKSDMDTFYRNNDFWIECVTGDEQFCQIIANLLAANYEINTPVEITVITGKDINKVYDLAGDNAYQNDTHHVIIPLKTLKNIKDTSLAKYTIKARYFNDVVDNNEYREYIAGRHEKSEQIQWLIDAHQ